MSIFLFRNRVGGEKKYHDGRLKDLCAACYDARDIDDFTKIYTKKLRDLKLRER